MTYELKNWITSARVHRPSAGASADASRQRFIQLPILRTLPVLGVPQQIVGHLRQRVGRTAARGRVGDGGHPVLGTSPDWQTAPAPKISSKTMPTRWTFSSPICTKQLPLSCSNSRASSNRSRRYRVFHGEPQTPRLQPTSASVRVNAQLPGVSEGANLLRVLGVPEQIVCNLRQVLAELPPVVA